MEIMRSPPSSIKGICQMYQSLDNDSKFNHEFEKDLIKSKIDESDLKKEAQDQKINDLVREQNLAKL